MSVVYTYPFMIGIVAVMRGSAPATLSLFVSLVACFLGIALIFGFSVDELSVVGISFALGQAVLAASRILLSAKLAPGTPGIALTARMLFVGVMLGLVMVPFMQLALPTDLKGGLAIGVAGLSSMIGHACLMWALQRIGPVPFGVLMNLEPVVAAIFVAVFLGQVLSPIQYTGGALVILAVTCFGFLERKRLVFLGE
jgi:drug/metabolite transporter (DMT)-like permease